MCPVSLFPQSRAHEPLQVFRQLCPVRYRNTSPSSDMANPTVRDRLCGRGDDHSESGSGPARGQPEVRGFALKLSKNRLLDPRAQPLETTR